MNALRAPFPYYGNKVRAAGLIEALMGPINNLVIPFAGALGELLGRSQPAKVETVNDADGLVMNAWRAIAYWPERVAELCDHPVHELTLHAAHDRLVARADELTERLRSDPRRFDVVLAAWWIWGRSAWLGGGWCARRPEDRGGEMRLKITGREGRAYLGQGVIPPATHTKIPALGGQGDRPHYGVGVTRRQMSGGGGRGVGHGCGVHSSTNRHALEARLRALADRLRWVRLICGDWRRAVTHALTTDHGVTGVSLDPPYDHDLRTGRLYREDHRSLSRDTREWAIDNGDKPGMRITLCGMPGEHEEVEGFGWSRHDWGRETIWASPHCEAMAADIGPLFRGVG